MVLQIALGIVLGFLFLAGIVIFFVLLAYLLQYLDEIKPKHQDKKDEVNFDEWVQHYSDPDPENDIEFTYYDYDERKDR